MKRLKSVGAAKVIFKRLIYSFKWLYWKQRNLWSQYHFKAKWNNDAEDNIGNREQTNKTDMDSEEKSSLVRTITAEVEYSWTELKWATTSTQHLRGKTPLWNTTPMDLWTQITWTHI